MRLRTIYSTSRNIMLRGNSKQDYQVCTPTERIGWAYKSRAARDGWQWRYQVVGRTRESSKFQAPTLRQLAELIEAEFVGTNGVQNG